MAEIDYLPRSIEPTSFRVFENANEIQSKSLEVNAARENIIRTVDSVVNIHYHGVGLCSCTLTPDPNGAEPSSTTGSARLQKPKGELGVLLRLPTYVIAQPAEHGSEAA